MTGSDEAGPAEITSNKEDAIENSLDAEIQGWLEQTTHEIGRWHRIRL